MVSARDLKRIRWGIAAALAMTLVGVAVVLASNQWLKQQQDAYRSAAKQRQDTYAKLRRAQSEEAEMKGKIAQFNDLQSRGIIGLEQRLVWVERIRQIREGLRLYGVDYEIAPQRPLERSVAPGSAGDYEFMTSAMRLRLDLLHEGDLLTFVDELAATVPAVVRVRDCQIGRLADTEGRASPAGPQLRAECTVDWITINERKPRT